MVLNSLGLVKYVLSFINDVTKNVRPPIVQDYPMPYVLMYFSHKITNPPLPH